MSRRPNSSSVWSKSAASSSKSRTFVGTASARRPRPSILGGGWRRADRASARRVPRRRRRAPAPGQCRARCLGHRRSPGPRGRSGRMRVQRPRCSCASAFRWERRPATPMVAQTPSAGRPSGGDDAMMGAFTPRGNPAWRCRAVGDQAPDFAIQATDGSLVRLAEQRGRKVVLFFYPRDDTPGCTREVCGFRDRMSEIAERGDRRVRRQR